MDISFLILSFVVLVILLAILIFFFLKSAKAKKLKAQAAKTKKKKPKALTLNDLRDRLKNKDLSLKGLNETVDLILKDYGVIKDFDIYLDIIFRLAHHSATDKDVVLRFDRELSKLNPEFATSISNNILNALNSR